MYDDDEQKKKRRRIIWGIIIAILLIIIIIILLLKGCGGGHTVVEEPLRELGCELQVVSGTQNENGEYTSDVIIEFASKTTIKDDIPIERYGIGKNKNYSGADSYTLSGVSGEQTVYGYIKDSAGNEAMCPITVKVNATVPTCNLKITQGTLGLDNWYISNVTVAFDQKNASSQTGTILEYYLSVNKDDFTNSAQKPTTNMESLIVSEDGNSVVYGYVKDSEGKEGICEIPVKRDATKPSCSLKVTSGKATNGVYSGNVVVGFNSTKEEASGLDTFGIGTSKNYEKKESYTYTGSATGNVYGYVKDKAGNEGTCSLQIRRSSGSGSGSGSTGSKPSCTISVSSGKKGDNGWYVGNVELKLNPSSNTTQYGIGTSKSYNNNKTMTVSKDGTTTVYGYVKNSSGEATCKLEIKKDSTAPSCSLKSVSGTYNQSLKTYTSAVTIQLSSRSDAVSGIATYGIDLSKNFNKKTSITISKSGNFVITGSVRDNAGNEATCVGKVTININGSGSGSGSGSGTTSPLTSAGAKIGDKVVYDAGKWPSTVAMPRTTNTFGNVTGGTNRGNGVTCDDGGTAKDGWEILSINNGVVQLISSGITECYYHALNANSSTAQSTLRARGSVYLNTTYATSATLLTREMINSSMQQLNSYSGVWKIGTAYYLASAADSGRLWGISASGTAFYYSARAYGVRPVITLKAGIKTSGKTSNGWVLVP